MKLFGLLGYAGAGKDTVFGILQGLEPRAVRYAFADELKREVADGFDVTPEFINENKPVFRELLQSWGVARRAFNCDYWVERVQESIVEDSPHIAVVTDVRFRNEAQWIREHGGSLVRVVRAGCEGVNNHVSEHELADCPVAHVIRNDAGFDELRDEVAAFYDQFIF